MCASKEMSHTGSKMDIGEVVTVASFYFSNNVTLCKLPFHRSAFYSCGAIGK